MAKDEFVPVAADDWYQRRRQDAEGAFFKKVSDQSPRKNAGTSTRQGIYMFTADGQLLGFRNHRDPAVMRSVLAQALKEFRKIPEEKRKPGAIKIDDPGQRDTTYHREPPKGALIVNAYTRILDRKGDGFCVGACEFTGGDQAARDRLWLTEQERKSLIPAAPKKGDKVTVPQAVLYRIARFHLVDNTRGEPPHWGLGEVRKATLTLTVENVSDSAVTLKLEGEMLLATDADPKKASRGYDVRLLGHVRYDVKKKAFDRFDAVALGEHWGEGPYTRGARPGRTPLGVAFELSTGAPSDRVPPQGSRALRGYLLADRE